jgi:hypothetical protein
MIRKVLFSLAFVFVFIGLKAQSDLPVKNIVMYGSLWNGATGDTVIGDAGSDLFRYKMAAIAIDTTDLMPLHQVLDSIAASSGSGQGYDSLRFSTTDNYLRGYIGGIVADSTLIDNFQSLKVGSGSLLVGYLTNPGAFEFAVDGDGYLSGDMSMGGRFMAEGTGDHYAKGDFSSGSGADSYSPYEFNAVDATGAAYLAANSADGFDSGIFFIEDGSNRAVWRWDSSDDELELFMQGSPSASVMQADSATQSITIRKNLTVNDTLKVPDGTLTIRSVDYLFPNADGTNDQVLTTNGTGGLLWSDKGSGTTSGITSLVGS